MGIPVVYVDDGGGGTGTSLSAENLNTAVPAQGYLISGGIPSTSASLVLSQPALQACVDTGSQVIYLTLASQSVPASGNLPASSDCYIDLDATGVYHVNSVANNNPAPSINPSGSLRLYKAVTSGTAVTSVTQLATPSPVGQTMVQTDTTEAATNDTLSVTGSTLQNNLNRMRYALQVITGASQATMASVLGAVAQMIPLSQKGSAGGVASLNSGTDVVQHSSWEGVASGVPTLDSHSHVQQQAVYDATEAATDDTLGGTSTIVNNLNRLRYVLGVIQGGAWNAATAMLPVSQKDAAGGVPSLDGSTLLTIGEARGMRQMALFTNTQNSPNLSATTYTTLPWSWSATPELVTHGGAIRCRLSLTGLTSGSAPVTVSWQVTINSATYALQEVYIAATSGFYGGSFVCKTPALAAATYPVTVQYKLGASGNMGANQGSIVLELEEVV